MLSIKKYILKSQKLLIAVNFICFFIWLGIRFDLFSKDLKKRDAVRLNSKCSCRDKPVYIYEYNKDYENTTCDLYNVLRRGYGQKVVSYSLYGTNELYYKELKYLTELVRKFYPTWIIRIYYDKTINSSVVCEYECLKDIKTGEYVDIIDFCRINEIPFGNPQQTWNAKFMHSMKWRFLPIGDPFVDMFMSRDLDSWIIDREVEAVGKLLAYPVFNKLLMKYLN